MELLTEKYKQTEIGLIPSDWKVDFIKNIAQIKTGSRNTQDRLENGLYPFFVRSQTIERINSYCYDGEAILTAGDGVGVGKVIHYVNEKFDCHQRVYRISDFKSNINGYYFYLYFSNNFYNRIMQMTAKSSVDSVRMEMIADMQIPLPPTLQEQTLIATALSNADTWITNLENLLAKKRQIKQGALQELLKPKKDWEVKKLGSISDITSAGIDKKINENEVPVTLLNYLDVYRRDYIYKSELNHKVTAPLDKVSSCDVREGDIFLTPSSELRTEIGISAIAMENMEGVVYSYHINRLRYKSGIDKMFGLYLLKTNNFLLQAETFCEGSGKRYVVSMGKFREMEVSYPKSKDEQKRIATILTDMDLEIEQLEFKIDKAKKVKQGMMQELLTGKIRLV